MSEEDAIKTDDAVDRAADEEIRQALSLEKPVSFFLFAGAGSGKTRSLVEALKYVCDSQGKRLKLSGQRVGVITYTKKARDEIKARLDYNELIEVSTIHSFAWSLICAFHSDIRTWLAARLQADIAELQAAQAKGRSGSKASIDRPKAIQQKTERLNSLAQIRKFTYSPDGDNRGRASLNHSEVIAITSDFLTRKPVMQSLLINRFPFLLIDESQDTNKTLMEALLAVQEQQKKNFLLGLFGDTMQRIYADGKADLGRTVPVDWAQPAKKMNHRSAKRIVKLINKIRASVDKQTQEARSNKEEGIVRLFVLPNSARNKSEAEKEIMERMASTTKDQGWSGLNREVKILILEHHMAARRSGFLEMYEPLYSNESLRIGLLDGTLSGLRLFSELVLPVVQNRANPFAVMSVIRKHSPLLEKETLRAAGDKQMKQIEKAKEAVGKLWSLWDDGKSPRFLDVLQCVHAFQLFEIPASLKLIASRSSAEQEIASKESETVESDEQPEEVDSGEIEAWDKFLSTPFNQIEEYTKYVEEKAEFDTHQGVKGLEFPRVMVIIDDTEARGFSFNYEKLFGVKEKTKDDVKSEESGKETGIDRTRRLFYVTCSRAEKSLAIVAYSEDSAKLKNHVLGQGWFTEDEVELLQPQN